MTTNNNETTDDFKFDDFLSEDTKKEIKPEATEVIPPKDEEVVASPQPTGKQEPVVENKESVEVQPEHNESSEPVRAPNEPDWKYDHRLEIWQKQQELRNATSSVEKKEIKSEVDGIRRRLAERSRVEDSTKTEEKPIEEEPIIPPADLYKVVNELVEQREYLGKLDDVEKNFLKNHKEVAQKASYDSFFNYVGEMYNLRGKTPKQVNAILELAYETLYPNRVEDKVSKSKELEKKIDAVDFSGSSASEPVVDEEKEEGRKLVDNIKKSSGNDFQWAID